MKGHCAISFIGRVRNGMPLISPASTAVARRVGPGIAWKERRTAPRHAASCSVHGLGEDVRDCGLGRADHVGVHAQSDSRIGVAQAGGDDMHWDA
jgi:hypothetical protein